jgi:hypothetical protein
MEPILSRTQLTRLIRQSLEHARNIPKIFEKRKIVWRRGFLAKNKLFVAPPLL